MSDQVLLSKHHPYIRHFYVSVYQVAGKWVVKWRDFVSMKQDAEFATRGEAQKFADEVRANAHVVDLWVLEDCCETFENVSSWWAGIDS